MVCIEISQGQLGYITRQTVFFRNFVVGFPAAREDMVEAKVATSLHPVALQMAPAHRWPASYGHPVALRSQLILYHWSRQWWHQVCCWRPEMVTQKIRRQRGELGDR